MKNVILTIAILIGISLSVNAQTSSKMKNDKQKMEMKMKDGVMMMNDKMMMCKDNKCTPMTETYTCTDGSKISMNGTVTKANGMTKKMKNGYEMEKSGKMAMIPHGDKGHICGKDCPMYKKM